jgi:hypothetical protein
MASYDIQIYRRAGEVTAKEGRQETGLTVSVIHNLARRGVIPAGCLRAPGIRGKGVMLFDREALMRAAAARAVLRCPSGEPVPTTDATGGVDAPSVEIPR